MALEWLNDFLHRRDKEADYAEKTLAAYELGMKAHGAIRGVVIEPGTDCCEAARRLPAGVVYRPGEAPRLPLPDCPQGRRCGCIYRPAMDYASSPREGK